MKRRLIALVLALCVFACACIAAPSASAASTKVYVTANTLKIYKSASTSSKALGIMCYGQSMTCTATSGDWARVKSSSGVTGYCKFSALSTSNPNNMNVSAKVNTANAPLYKRPDTGTAVWMKLKKGAVFTAVAMTRDNAWVRLKNGKYYGYIQAKHLTTASEAPTATPKPTAAPTQAPLGTVYAAATEVKVHQDASASSKALGSLYFGQSATCLSYGDGWAKVKTGSITGHAQMSGLSAKDTNTLSTKVRVTTANAPIHKKPVANAAVWMKLKKNSSYTAVAVSQDGAWTRIQNGKYFAYIQTKYLSSSTAAPTPTAAPTAAPTAKPDPRDVYVAANTLKVYKSASTTASTLATLGYGEGLTLTDTSGAWAQVRLSSGKTGYCSGGSLTTKDPNTYFQTVYIAAANAPIYKLPQSGLSAWMKLKKNAAYTAVAITSDGNWFRLKNGKYYAYIESKNVSAMKDEGSQTVYVNVLKLPVYAEASTSAKGMGSLYLGQSVALIGSADGWAKVKNDAGAMGYCLINGLSKKNINALNKPYYAKSKGVKLYSKPATDGTVVKTAELNESLMVVCMASDEGWARVALTDGAFAYARTSDLSAKKITDGSLIVDIDPVTVYVTPTTLNVYASASTSAKSLGTMCFGESMRCTGRSDTWARVVNSAGAVGYCDVKSVATKDPNAYATALYAQAKGAKVYQRAQTSSKVIATLSLNDKVTGVCYNSDRSWYRVKNGDAYGYVQAAFFATTEMKDSAQSGTIAKVIALAKSYLGVPYVYGGQSPKGFDCSGLVYYCFKNAAGVTLKRTAYTQGYDNTYPKITNKVDLKAGDVLYFNTVDDDDACDHAGIYLGSNQFIHASSGGGKVMISSLGTDDKSYYFRTYSWARRILN